MDTVPASTTVSHLEARTEEDSVLILQSDQGSRRRLTLAVHIDFGDEPLFTVMNTCIGCGLQLERVARAHTQAALVKPRSRYIGEQPSALMTTSQPPRPC